MAYLLGIDVGTSSTKALVMDETGKHISCGRVRYDIAVPEAGYAEQDCGLLWNAVCKAIREAVSEITVKKEIRAVGVTGQMHGLILLDKEKKPLRPAIIWADHRSVRQADILKGCGIEARVGNSASPGLFLSSLLWIKENESELYAKARYTLLPKDFIRYRLCGLLGTDYSDATGTLLFNLKSGTWDEVIMKRYGIEKSLLPECHASCEIAGKTTFDCAAATGLLMGIPVIYGGGDTPMQLVGNGMLSPGQLNTNIGTASQINGIFRSLPQTDGRINIFHHIPEHIWLAVGAGLNGGIIMKWLQNNIFRGYENFDQMSRAASESPPGAGGVVCLPFLNGERSPYMDGNAKAILYGLTLSHTRNDIIRAAMESVVYSFRDCINVFRDMELPVGDEIIASGGGAKSDLWLQMQADILQKTILTTEEEEEACKGAAISAGVGCGIYASLEEGCLATVHLSCRRFEPQMQNSVIYEERFQTYLALYQNNKVLWQPAKE